MKVKIYMLTLDKNGWWNPLGGHIEKKEAWREVPEQSLIREFKEEA